ncbi:MAG: hypothetical protein WBW51_12240, partial [Methyloceanibacter sp.]
PMDAIGRGDDTLVIEERPEPVTASAQVLAPFAPRVEKPVYGEIVDVSPKAERERPAAMQVPPAKTAAPEAPRSTAEQRLKPAIFVPERPPDDPGVAQTETDESPTSLERLRAAQIR